MNSPKIVSKNEFFGPIGKQLKRSILKAAKKFGATQIVSLTRPDGQSEVVFAGPDLQWETWKDVQNDHPEYVVDQICMN